MCTHFIIAKLIIYGTGIEFYFIQKRNAQFDLSWNEWSALSYVEGILELRIIYTITLLSPYWLLFNFFEYFALLDLYTLIQF